jgi:hypothetical protein
MTALPSWIPQETWDAFVEMRKKTLKKPPTDFALNLILRELFKLRDAGNDPLACLEQSIVQGWADVYPLKAKKLDQAVSSSDVARTKAALQADELSARGITKEDLAENARKARERFGRKPAQGELH